MSLKHELQNIIGGDGSVRYGETIQAIKAYLRREKSSISTTKEAEYCKKEETEVLISFIEKRQLWFEIVQQSLDYTNYCEE